MTPRVKRGDRVWFWFAHRQVRTYVHRVKGSDAVCYVAGSRVQLPLTRLRRLADDPPR